MPSLSIYLRDGPVNTLGHALLEQSLGNIAQGMDDGADKAVVAARLQHHLHVALQQREKSIRRGQEKENKTMAKTFPTKRIQQFLGDALVMVIKTQNPPSGQRTDEKIKNVTHKISLIHRKAREKNNPATAEYIIFTMIKNRYLSICRGVVKCTPNKTDIKKAKNKNGDFFTQTDQYETDFLRNPDPVRTVPMFSLDSKFENHRSR